MTSEVFTNYTTESLIKRIRFSSLALYTVWAGGTIGILASLSQIITSGGIESTTFVISVIALLVSIPVYRERQQIVEIVQDREA